MLVTLRGPSRSSLVARAALLTSVVVLVVVVVAGDRGARRHSAWRDPISWFAADEAPHPYWTRAALVVVAGSLVVVALTLSLIHI